MSKMPAKKRSCFQITSVTQAQVAAVGAADDTESLDDPDESQAEDVSGMYEASRSEYEPACERSSSDEALNNVAEATVNAPQIRGGPNQPGTSVAAGSGLQCQPAAGASPGVSANTAQPAPAPGTGSVSCSSRFRVIKLDHGTGEPFRRGRWTCTEFYEKDSESSHAGRTDSIRHASVTLDPAADRDSGLGPSVGTPATLSGPGLVSMAEGSQCSLLQQQVVHQSYSSQQHGGSASATHSFSGGNPAALASQPSFGQNGLPHAEVHTQNSPMMPPSYPPQQPVPGVHPITSQPSGPEYYQQTGTIPPDLSGGQPVPMSGLSGHVPSPVMPPASGPSQVGDVCVPAQAGPAALAPLQHPQTIGFGVPGGPMLPGGPTPPHQTTSQYAPAAQAQPIGHTASSGVQNVPAAGAGSSVPGAVLSASSATMPNVTISLLPLGLMAHSKPPEALGVPGLPAAGFGQVEASGGRKSEGAVVAQSPVVSGREAMKPFMPETLQFTTPSVTSLFGIHIPVDGEEDRNPSTAFYQAFQSGSRLGDSKAHSDSASGTNIVAIDNKIEQAMDLVKSHLMYAVREEVEVLKEQIKELFERNSVLERENAVLKSLANSEQLSQLSAQTGAAATPGSASTPALQPQSQTQPDGGQQPQPNVTSA